MCGTILSLPPKTLHFIPQSSTSQNRKDKDNWTINLEHCSQLRGHVRIFTTPWTVACLAPLFMEFSKYYSALSFSPSRVIRGLISHIKKKKALTITPVETGCNGTIAIVNLKIVFPFETLLNKTKTRTHGSEIHSRIYHYTNLSSLKWRVLIQEKYLPTYFHIF